jgi:hypothetical protein
LKAQRDGQNRGRKRQFEQKDFHARQFRESRSKSNVWRRTEKSQRSKDEKIEARKTVEDGDFCARLLFRR